MTDTYAIVEAQRPVIGGLGGHDLLVLEDTTTGMIVDQINGLAKSSDGSIKPIG